MEGYLISWILYDLWIVVLLFYIKSHSLQYIKSKKVSYVTFLILFLIIVFGEHSGDFRHYETIIHKFSVSNHVATNFEPVYIWLTKATGYNIFLFRAVIGSFIIIAIYHIFNLFKELNSVAIFIFTLIPFYFISNAIRQGIAICICLLGIFYIFNNKKFKTALILFIFSLFLHKSMILIVPALLFLYLPLRKITVLILLLMLPMIIYIENVLLNYYMTLLMKDGVIAIYMMNKIAETSTFWVRLMDSIVIIVILILTYLSLRKLSKVKTINNNRSLKLMSRFLFGCSYMYVVYYGLDIDIDIVAARFAPFLYIPLVIVMMKAYGIRILQNRLIGSLLMIYFVMINLQIYRWFLVFF